MFNFEKLDVWQKAIDFADLIYTNTRVFPADERFSLTTQLRRGAVSISSNIAEDLREVQKLTLRVLSRSRVALSSRSFLSLLSRVARIFSATRTSGRSTR